MEETLHTLLAEIKAEHPKDGKWCKTCLADPGTADWPGQQHPCKTLQVVARIEALIREASRIEA